ncbi:TonB-dependent receptor plug domain-containing protein [Salinivibrio costicola]|uniref:TonB-dependent receptor plug domain-containing protein n=1 Tax=Salinivibrio costicola TaxID=51367 RepID=A0ABX6K9I1_SALCS|nr:TonB-dependent receptor plug domain-containing protein [Salinivibrio costicola]QIR07103.1 TonB-dependent receptor plug domain-containing protein [Salinivibrio costicola]
MTLLLPAKARPALLALSIASALCPSAMADSPEGESIETVSVWGTKVSSSSRYLGEADLTVKQPDHLSDLLRDIPGVDVGGTHSLTQRINIRGFTEQDLDITVDGASQGGKMFHHISNLTLNPDILQRVDVAVGASSILTSELGARSRLKPKIRTISCVRMRHLGHA